MKSSREYTLNDFWSINLEKMIEWNAILVDNIDQEWKGEDESDSEEEDGEVDHEEEGEDEDYEESNSGTDSSKQHVSQQSLVEQDKEDENGIPFPGETLRGKKKEVKQNLLLVFTHSLHFNKTSTSAPSHTGK